MTVEVDGNGNQLAWWRPAAVEAGGAVLLGSHLDSVPGGGAFDGPLGIASAFAALDVLRARGWQPSRPVGVANFTDEEGGRFGVACVGSRLVSGAMAPDAARALVDDDGVPLADVMRARGVDPAGLGPAAWLDGVALFIELHIEQGRYLADAGVPVGVADAIWPHGRWRVDISGESNHAGTTPIHARHDPMIALAELITAARVVAEQVDARATVGKVDIRPGGTNVVASEVTAWLDLRAPDDATLDAMVTDIAARVHRSCAAEGTSANIRQESRTPAVLFDKTLRDRLVALTAAPVIPTAAGHDAGVLHTTIPTGMLFVRNVTGVSHAAAEFASTDDVASGVAALVTVIEDIA